MQMFFTCVEPLESVETSCSTPWYPLAAAAFAVAVKAESTYPRCTALEIAYVYMLEQDVSRKLPFWPGRSTICHQRPVAGSWNLMTACTRLLMLAISGVRSAVSEAGMFSSTST